MLQAKDAAELTLGIRDVVWVIGIVISGTAIWWKQNGKINGFGKRVDDVEVASAACLKLGDKMVLELENAHNERGELRERVAQVETLIDAIKEELSEERLAVMTTLHNNERAAAERDAQLREQLAGLRERMDIQRIVKTVVQEFKGGS